MIYLVQLENLFSESFSELQCRENLCIQLLFKIQFESLCYNNESIIYKELVAHLVMMKKEMPACKNALCKTFKDSVKKKFDTDKNKNKNHNKSDKNILLSISQSDNKFRHSDFFNDECNYCYKYDYKAEDCCKYL